MVIARILIPIGIVGVLVVIGFFLFKKFNIGELFTSFLGDIQKFGEDVAKGAGEITEQISQAVGDTGKAIQDSVDDAGNFIFQAGVDARTSVDEISLTISDAFTDLFFPSTQDAKPKSTLEAIAEVQQIDPVGAFVGDEASVLNFLEASEDNPVFIPEDTISRGETRFNK